ncbi:MAG: MarC family protein [Candidatus Pacebacteria bacterium]|nr:MarC family protein [Candidatus Paceibacterota bacterium]
MDSKFLQSYMLFLMLLNPFLVVVYLLELVQELDVRVFSRVLVRAGITSVAVFVVFAIVGDAIFSELLQAHFASFQIFGGVVFLVMGVRFVFSGNAALQGLRGEPEHIAGSIAMPIMIGPATVSASILAGQRLRALVGAGVILCAVATTVGAIILMKIVHDYVKPRNEKLVERYVDIAGRIAALIVGTFAVEMIMVGLQEWSNIIFE